MKEFFIRHPNAVKYILLGYIVFAGCFTFPISSERFPLDWSKVYLLVVGYGVIGLGFAGVYGPGKEKRVYLLTLVLTVLGLVCRYFLEFGEVSNTYNFTLFNVVLYLVLIPLGTVFAYAYLSQHALRKDGESE